ncbi:hypothetical protein FHG87_023161 [Trinorchestia longiramus]|nr:hypothetical protein FHG87_023161 [Trinorchestia longiramus]
MQITPPILLDMTTIPGASSSTDENDLQPEDGNVALKDTDGTIYTFPLEFLDVDNCIGTSPCGPTCYYNRGSRRPASFYLSDYCGGEILDDIYIGDVFFSHRGFGCEYMPDELVGQDCVVKYTMGIYILFTIHLFDLDDSGSCDGFSLLHRNVDEDYDICADTKRKTFYPSFSNQYTISVTKQQRLGFVVVAS